ncbi:MAG: hypothetical protein K6C97_10350 [Treponema sp.]|nr:hypothetical protein [Treponema sp.]
MKLDPVFTVKENKLYKIADNSQVDPNTLRRIEIPWTTVEMEEESYNEEFLALLRDQLKGMEAAGIFAILVPLVDKPLETSEQVELFTKAFNHTARRVKDCVSVAGFELPKELKDIQSFIDTIAIKHAQYVYFTKVTDLASDTIVKY